MQHSGVAADLSRRARGDETSGVEHVDVVADREHQRHVVVDEEQTEPRRRAPDGGAPRAPRSRSGRALRQARRASRAWAGPRSRAPARPTCARLETASSADGRRRRRGRAASRAAGDIVAVLRAPPEDHIGERPPPLRALGRDPHVVRDGHVLEQLERLECAGELAQRAPMGPHTGDVSAVEADRAARDRARSR